MGKKGTKRHLTAQTVAMLSLLLEQQTAAAADFAAATTTDALAAGALAAKACKWGYLERVEVGVYRATPRLLEDVDMWGGLGVVRRWRLMPQYDARSSPSALAWRHMRAVVACGGAATNVELASHLRIERSRTMGLTRNFVNQGWLEGTLPPRTRGQRFQLTSRAREWLTRLTKRYPVIKEKPKRGGARPGAGRPKLPNAKQSLTVRITPADRSWVNVTAKSSHVSVSAVVQAALRHAQADPEFTVAT